MKQRGRQFDDGEHKEDKESHKFFVGYFVDEVIMGERLNNKQKQKTTKQFIFIVNQVVETNTSTKMASKQANGGCVIETGNAWVERSSVA